MNKIDKLIINSPYSEPTHYWSYDRETRSFSLAEGRRPAGYVIASETSKSFDDPGIFKEISLVDLIRPRIKKWREAGYPRVSGITKRSHIDFCVFDSTWESTEAFQLDQHPNVSAWVKNDHLGFEIPYMFQGVVHKYRPDYPIKLKDESYLIVEVKGQEDQQDKVKWDYLVEWVQAVNEYGGFGKWDWKVVNEPQKILEILV